MGLELMCAFGAVLDETTAEASDIQAGKTAYNGEGELLTGTYTKPDTGAFVFSYGYSDRNGFCYGSNSEYGTASGNRFTFSKACTCRIYYSYADSIGSNGPCGVYKNGAKLRTGMSAKSSVDVSFNAGDYVSVTGGNVYGTSYGACSAFMTVFCL